MGITLIVARSSGNATDGVGDTISLDEWLALVDQDPALRLRTEPVSITHPRTNERICMDPLPGQTELALAQNHVPFLGHLRGRLVMGYSPALEDKANPVRQKIVEIARRLGAAIRHDAGDGTLDW